MLTKINQTEEQFLHQSFATLCNTLDGLRGLKTLYLTTVKGKTIESIEIAEQQFIGQTCLENMSAFDIIEVFSIVGIPIQCITREYADPFMFEITTMFCGQYVSLSDVIAKSNDAQLRWESRNSTILF
eukprot:UN03318